MPDGRPFFVIGQWLGPDLTVWDVQAAPEDPGALNDTFEEIRWEAHDADGSVEVVYAASAEEAEATARREAAETDERIRRDLKQQRESRSPATSRRRRRVTHRYT
ncbi:hypothetical protein [Streptomyces sp. NPDC127038]|uniref:hypothetical protein n=1 Tax=Streptomyces sp. NPDC127038 TaxID=3347114 RepID=UPI00365061E1